MENQEFPWGRKSKKSNVLNIIKKRFISMKWNKIKSINRTRKECSKIINTFMTEA